MFYSNVEFSSNSCTRIRKGGWGWILEETLGNPRKKSEKVHTERETVQKSCFFHFAKA